MKNWVHIITLAAALTAGGKGVDMALVSGVDTVRPGQPFLVGLKVHHHEGFHTYWRSPGIVGVPFALKWEVPEG